MRAVALPGAQVHNNATAGASYSYDPAKKEFVSYDTPEIVKQKAKYIQDKGLAGAMFWEVSSTYPLAILD
jgi:chitinase